MCVKDLALVYRNHGDPKGWTLTGLHFIKRKVNTGENYLNVSNPRKALMRSQQVEQLGERLILVTCTILDTGHSSKA